MRSVMVPCVFFGRFWTITAVQLDHIPTNFILAFANFVKIISLFYEPRFITLFVAHTTLSQSQNIYSSNAAGPSKSWSNTVLSVIRRWLFLYCIANVQTFLRSFTELLLWPMVVTALKKRFKTITKAFDMRRPSVFSCHGSLPIKYPFLAFILNRGWIIYWLLHMRKNGNAFPQCLLADGAVLTESEWLP